MPNNFRNPLSIPARWLPYFDFANGQVFFSKAGANGAAGTADAPLARPTFSSLHDAARQLKVFGTGQYTYVLDPAVNNYNYENWYMVGDGKVVISGDNTGSLFFPFQKLVLFNLEFSRYEYFFKDAQAVFPQLLQCVFRDGKFQSISGGSNVSADHVVDCIFINCEITKANFAPVATDPTKQIHHNLFINTPGDAAQSDGQPGSNYSHLSYCYFDATSVWKWSSSYLPKFCNIRGPLYVDGVRYNSLADAAVVWPNLLAFGNINADPKFNRAAAEDFTLMLSSPHLDLGIGPSHLRYALMYYVEFDGIVGELCTVQNTRLRSTADGSIIRFTAIDGFTVNEKGALIIATNSSNNYEGSYTTDRIRVAATAQPIESIPVIFQANFDSDFPTSENAFDSKLPEVYNNNVPAYANNTSGSAGRNPRRLTVRIRFSPNLNPDIAQSGDWVLGVWMEYEIGQRPTYNVASALGNGSPGFDATPSATTQMVARWVQLSYRARNNYYSR